VPAAGSNDEHSRDGLVGESDGRIGDGDRDADESGGL
jgi:hypothetical protein